MLGRQQIALDVEDEDLRAIMSNSHVNDHFLSLAREVFDRVYYYFRLFLYMIYFLVGHYGT